MDRRVNLLRQGAFSFGVTFAVLAVNVVSGILVARVLGPPGRGELTAVFAAVPIVGWVFEMGCRAAVTYHQARHPEDGPRLLTAWLVMLVPFAAAAILVGELVLPHLLSAQSHEVLTLARLMMLTIAFLFFSDLMYSVLLGDHDFLFYNAMRLWQPAATTVAYVLLWASGALTVETAVASMFVASLVDNVVVGTRVFRTRRLGRFDFALARRSLWYGVRAHGTAAGNLVTTRLDLMIIPAFLSASSVGLYATATTVSWLVVTVASSLAALVLPIAVRRGGEEGPATVVRALYATLLVGAAIAAVLALVAGVAVRLVYGAEFAASVEPLRVLLLGSVLYAGAGVLWSGLYALDRPFTAALTQLAGVIVTVVGLLAFLERGGIQAAALISTISYTLVFASALVAYRRAAGLSWGRLAPPTSLARDWWRQASRLVISRAA